MSHRAPLRAPLRVIDLFCGCGGWSKGATDAGAEVVVGVDIWDVAVRSYNKNFTHEALCRDLREYTPKMLEEEMKWESNDIDVLLGSPPCQGFSMAGRRDASDERNNLFEAFVAYRDYFRPRVFMMENVMGMLSMKNERGERVMDAMMAQLERGYRCAVWKLYASDYEVPQNRRRVIVVGVRDDIDATSLLTPPSPLSPRPSVAPVLTPREHADAALFLSERAIRGINNKIKKSRESGKGFGAQFLRMDAPSYTIPARYWKDGYDALVRYDDETMRRLSITELKRIQSFPDDYALCGSKKDVIIQIGNAVPCRFAYHLVTHIIRTLPPPSPARTAPTP